MAVREVDTGTPVFRVQPLRLILFLAAAMILLVLASVAGQVSKYFLGHDQVGGLVRLFYVDAEANLPTWYSTVTLLLCAALLAAIALHHKAAQNRQFFRWAGLSVLFLCLSADEAAQIHEISWRLTGRSPLIEKWFPAEWVGLGLAFALVVAIVYGRFLFSLSARTRNLFIAAGILYVSGAVGLETVGWGLFAMEGSNNFRYAMAATAEELLEMSGGLVFLWALLDYLQTYVGQVTIRFGKS